MRVRSADITPNVVRVATIHETWLLFRHGLLTEDVEADLSELLDDLRVVEAGD